MRLSEDQKAEAFLSGWQTSFDGQAILDKSLKFLDVNPQLYQILEVTGAEIIGQSMDDLLDMRGADLNQRNARLVTQGHMRTYVMDRIFQPTQKQIICSVTRIPQNLSKEHQLFLCRIILSETPTQLEHNAEVCSSSKGARTSLYSSISAILGGVLIYLWEHFNK